MYLYNNNNNNNLPKEFRTVIHILAVCITETDCFFFRLLIIIVYIYVLFIASASHSPLRVETTQRLNVVIFFGVFFFLIFTRRVKIFCGFLRACVYVRVCV